MKYISEFSREGKTFVYINLTGLKSNIEFYRALDEVKQFMVQYEPKSVYTIVDIHDIMFDTVTRDIFVEMGMINKNYAIKGAILGMDGIKSIMFKTIFQRVNSPLEYQPNLETAVTWLSNYSDGLM